MSWAKYVLVILGVVSYIVHGVGIFLDSEWYSFVIYVRNMFYGTSLLVATILILDFLSFHHLFGPWAIIIGELLLDVGKFVVVLSLFIAGYSLMMSSMNLPFGFEKDYQDNTNRSLGVNFITVFFSNSYSVVSNCSTCTPIYLAFFSNISIK